MSEDFIIDPRNEDIFLNFIPYILFEESNKLLESIPSDEEVKKAVFSFEGNKALGLDGFPIFFFQYFWEYVGKDVTATKEFFSSPDTCLKSLTPLLLF